MKYHPNRWNKNPHLPGNQHVDPVYTEPRINLTSVPGYVAHKRPFGTAHVYAMWINLCESDTPPTQITNKHGVVIGFSYGQAYVIYAASNYRPVFIYDKQIKLWFEAEADTETSEMQRARKACRPPENITVLDAVAMDLVRRYGFNAVARMRMRGQAVTAKTLRGWRQEMIDKLLNASPSPITWGTQTGRLP